MPSFDDGLVRGVDAVGTPTWTVFAAITKDVLGTAAPRHIVMSPLEFIQRLAAHVPRPRFHLPMTASRLSTSSAGCPLWVEAV